MIAKKFVKQNNAKSSRSFFTVLQGVLDGGGEVDPMRLLTVLS